MKSESMGAGASVLAMSIIILMVASRHAYALLRCAPNAGVECLWNRTPMDAKGKFSGSRLYSRCGGIKCDNDARYKGVNGERWENRRVHLSQRKVSKIYMTSMEEVPVSKIVPDDDNFNDVFGSELNYMSTAGGIEEEPGGDQSITFS